MTSNISISLCDLMKTMKKTSNPSPFKMEHSHSVTLSWLILHNMDKYIHLGGVSPLVLSSLYHRKCTFFLLGLTLVLNFSCFGVDLSFILMAAFTVSRTWDNVVNSLYISKRLLTFRITDILWKWGVDIMG